MAGISITLTKCVFNPVDDLASESFFFVDGETAQIAPTIDIRPYANGRRRAITTPGYDQSVSITLNNVSRTDVQTLEAWAKASTFLLYRDPRQRRVFGVITDLSTDEIEGVDLANVTVTFNEVTHDEAV